MTARGRLVLALGAGAYVASWAFGSRPLVPLAFGLVLAPLLAAARIRLATGDVRLRQGAGRREALEGDDVVLDGSVDVRAPLPARQAILVQREGRLGELRVELRWQEGELRGSTKVSRLRRGRYAFEAALVLEDPFGLAHRELPLAGDHVLLVYPRLVELARPFSEAYAEAVSDGRRLLRAQSGFDLHGVREYQQGESLRRVHWRSTAHRGRLMVKELEDAPRDEVVVLLDADASAAVPDAFDTQVRAAGSLLLSHVDRARRAALVVNALRVGLQRVNGREGWGNALELLAAVEPTGRRRVSALLDDREGPAASALELAVVTARLEAPLVDRLVQRAAARQHVSLVLVDPVSFAAPAAPRRLEAGLLRLQAAGVPVTVLRRGDDLAARLSARPYAGADTA